MAPEPEESEAAIEGRVMDPYEVRKAKVRTILGTNREASLGPVTDADRHITKDEIFEEAERAGYPGWGIFPPGQREC